MDITAAIQLVSGLSVRLLCVCLVCVCVCVRLDSCLGDAGVEALTVALPHMTQLTELFLAGMAACEQAG